MCLILILKPNYTPHPPGGKAAGFLTEALNSQTQQPVPGIEPGPQDHKTSTDPLCDCADERLRFDAIYSQKWYS